MQKLLTVIQFLHNTDDCVINIIMISTALYYFSQKLHIVKQFQLHTNNFALSKILQLH